MKGSSLFLGATLLLAGCGGSAPPPSGFANPQVSIEWGPRSRTIQGPGSALSAVITFTGAGSNGQDVSFEVDRHASPGDYTQTYACPAQVHAGGETMHVWFQSEAGGTGSVVARADVSVIVTGGGVLQSSSGAPLGTVKATGQIRSLNIPQGETVVLGKASDLPVTAIDLNNNVIALTPGSVFYTITPGGGGAASLNASGQIVGSALGGIGVSATVDGVTSASMGVQVLPAPVASSVMSQATNALVADPQTGHLWASVPGTDPPYGNCVIEIDPGTAKLLSSIYVGSEPEEMAISDDGSTLYVALVGAGSVAQVDLIGKKLVSTFGDVTGYPYALAVEPGNPNAVAVTSLSYNTTGTVGPDLYVGGSRLAKDNAGGLYLGFVSPTTLWTDGGYAFGLVKCTVGPAGLTISHQAGSAESAPFREAGGNLYVSDGSVVSGTTGSLLGTCGIPANQMSYDTPDVAVDPGSHLVFFLEVAETNQPMVLAFDTSSYKMVGAGCLGPSVGTPGADGPMGTATYSLTRWGAKGLAFRDPNGIYLVPEAPGL